MASEIAIDLCDLPVVKSALFVTVVIRILLPPVTRSPRVGTKTRVSGRWNIFEVSSLHRT